MPETTRQRTEEEDKRIKAALTQPKTLLEALLAFQKDMKGLSVGKSGENLRFKSKYVKLEDLNPPVIELLTKHGLTWVTCPGITSEAPDTIVLRYRLNFKDEELGGDLPLLGVTTMQELGSALTYAKRQALQAVTGVVAEEDDDGAAASQGKAPVRALVEASQASRSPRKLDSVQEANMVKKIKQAGISLDDAYDHAQIDPAKGVTVEQALKVDQLIKAQ